MRLIVVMAGNDLRRRLRDRSALITAFLAPFALAAIISLALGAGGEGLDVRVGVVDADGSATSRDLTARLLEFPGAGGRPQDGALSFVAVASEDAAIQDITPNGWERPWWSRAASAPPCRAAAPSPSGSSGTPSGPSPARSPSPSPQNWWPGSTPAGFRWPWWNRQASGASRMRPSGRVRPRPCSCRSASR